MASLDDVDIRTILQLEDDLTDKTLDGFIDFIRTHYGLANVAYLCPSFRGRTIADPFDHDLSRRWIRHYKDQNYTFIDPVVNLGARSILPLDWARLPREDKKVSRMFGEAKEMGVGHQGLTIPVRGPINGLWSLFVVTCNDGEARVGGAPVTNSSRISSMSRIMCTSAPTSCMSRMRRSILTPSRNGKSRRWNGRPRARLSATSRF